MQESYGTCLCVCVCLSITIVAVAWLISMLKLRYNQLYLLQYSLDFNVYILKKLVKGRYNGTGSCRGKQMMP